MNTPQFMIVNWWIKNDVVLRSLQYVGSGRYSSLASEIFQITVISAKNFHSLNSERHK